MWFGKVIGGLIGLFAGGPIGLILGIIAGHYFDKALAGFSTRLSPGERKEIEETFFQTVFLLLGRLAKSDGRVSETEIAFVEHLMAQMSLHSDHRREAIALFKKGADGDFDLGTELARFRAVAASHPVLTRQLINYLLALSLADGVLSSNEEQFLREVAAQLGISARLFEQLLRMVRAQSHFGHRDSGQAGGGYQAPGEDELTLAYDALGVDKSASDAELKKAYRRLMSENHPDKLMGQGVPEDMIKVATERSQEIRAAYDLIKRHRQDG